jgi:hypothetical protein
MLNKCEGLVDDTLTLLNSLMDWWDMLAGIEKLVRLDWQREGGSSSPIEVLKAKPNVASFFRQPATAALECLHEAIAQGSLNAYLRAQNSFHMIVAGCWSA